MDIPSLIEPNVKYYLHDRLKICHENKMNAFSWVFNIGVFVIFFSLLFVVLYLSRKEKLSPYEKHEQLLKDQQYVMLKIRDYKEMHKNNNSSLITELPTINQS